MILILIKQDADGRENVLDEQTRVLALQLLDGHLHFLRRQMPTENGRGRQVPSVARVTSDEEVVPIEEAEISEAKTSCGAEDGVGVSTGLEGNDAREGEVRTTRPTRSQCFLGMLRVLPLRAGYTTAASSACEGRG